MSAPGCPQAQLQQLFSGYHVSGLFPSPGHKPPSFQAEDNFIQGLLWRNPHGVAGSPGARGYGGRGSRGSPHPGPFQTPSPRAQEQPILTWVPAAHSQHPTSVGATAHWHRGLRKQGTNVTGLQTRCPACRDPLWVPLWVFPTLSGLFLSAQGGCPASTATLLSHSRAFSQEAELEGASKVWVW